MGDTQVVWDADDDPDGNIQHIAENDLAVEEVEDVLLNPENDTLVSRTSGRPITFGWTSTGRMSNRNGGNRESPQTGHREDPANA